MKIKLKQRWGSHLPRTEISVSNERGEYLIEMGVAKSLEPEKPKVGRPRKNK